MTKLTFFVWIKLLLIVAGTSLAQTTTVLHPARTRLNTVPVFDHQQSPRNSAAIFEGMAVYPDSVVYEYFNDASQSHHINQIVVYTWNNQTLPSTIKIYDHENGQLQQISSSQLTYNSNGQLIQIETSSTDTSELSNNRIVQQYNAQGDLISCKILIPQTGGWQLYRHDSAAFEYADQRPVSIVRFYALGNDTLNAYRRFFDIQHNASGQIISYKEMRKDILGIQWEPGYGFYTNLQWHAGYNDKMMGYYNGWLAKDFIPTFPRRSYNVIKSPTAMTSAYVSPTDTQIGVIYSNNGWQQGQLTVYLNIRNSSGNRDTVESTTYRRDAQSRIIESSSRIRINRNLPWYNNQYTAEKTTFSFDALGFNVQMNNFYRYHPAYTNWTDSTQRTRDLNLGTAGSSQVWQIIDSSESNGIMLPASRETHFFGQIAAGITRPNLVKSTVFPNPTRDYFYVTNLSSFGESCQIRLYNAVGNLILTDQLASSQGEAQKVQLPQIAPGIYVVILESSKGLASQRLVIR